MSFQSFRAENSQSTQSISVFFFFDASEYTFAINFSIENVYTNILLRIGK